MPDTIPEINFTLDPSETIPAPVDPSLSIEGMAADAQATGEALALKLTTYGELDPLDAPQGTDEIPVGRNEAGYKIDLATLAEALRVVGNFLQSTGDTMTGALAMKSSDYDISQANNGTSETLWKSQYRLNDKNNVVSNLLGAVIHPGGNVQTRITAINLKSNGETTSNSITIGVDKDGNANYGVGDPTAFRTAIAAMYRNNLGALNLDNMQYNGMGYVAGGSSPTLGSNLNGVVLTISNGSGVNNGSYGVQFWSSVNGNIIAFRRLQNNAWQAWQKVTFTEF